MSDRIKVISPSGKVGSIPADQLQSALAAGYKSVSGGDEADAGPETAMAEHAETPSSTAPAPAGEAEPGLLASLAGQMPGFVAGLGRGALKGAAGMVSGAGEMVHQIPGVSSAVDAMYGTPGLSRNAFAEAKAETAPHGVGETVGHGAANLAALALAPESSVPAMMGGTALITGAQTGGDPVSMGTSAATAGVVGGASSLMGRGANAVREGQAETVSAARTAAAAKQGLKGQAARNAMNDPLWMEAQAVNTGKYADKIKQYGLTGGPKDIEIIKAAPPRDQEVLSALSRQMDPSKKQFGHEWSVAELLASALPGAAVAAGGSPLGGVTGTAGMLLIRSLMKKYPGLAAKGLDSVGAGGSVVAPYLGGAAGNMVESEDPLVKELMRRNGGGE